MLKENLMCAPLKAFKDIISLHYTNIVLMSLE